MNRGHDRDEAEKFRSSEVQKTERQTGVCTASTLVFGRSEMTRVKMAVET